MVVVAACGNEVVVGGGRGRGGLVAAAVAVAPVPLLHSPRPGGSDMIFALSRFILLLLLVWEVPFERQRFLSAPFWQKASALEA